MIRHPPISPLFPYTTLFRSLPAALAKAPRRRERLDRGRPHRLRDRLRPPQLHRIRPARSEEHTSELQSRENLVCRLLLEKKKKKKITHNIITKLQHNSVNTT